ncbi:hypothetical protein BKA64DRAFT_55466 [Cadophora sp. MPI-SDFR-AT-0126]|nr:hypothetical protein BKA64DRAFT_55466 [Leotiomycetes sp. MPI-SDFR-AT-0126]
MYASLFSLFVRKLCQSFGSDIDISQPQLKEHSTKAERAALNTTAESRSKILGGVHQPERKPRRSREVMQPNGTWGTAANTLPLSRNRMLEPDPRDHLEPSTTIKDVTMNDQTPAPAPAPAPTLISASFWYPPPKSQVSRNFNAGFPNNVDLVPSKPYTLTRFSREDILYSHPIPETTPTHSVSYPPQYSSYTDSLPRHPHSPHNLPHMPDASQRQETTRQSRFTTYDVPSRSSLTLTPTPSPTPTSLPPHLHSYPHPHSYTHHTQTPPPSPATTYHLPRQLQLQN